MKIPASLYLALALIAGTIPATAASPENVRLVATVDRDQFNLQVTNTGNHNIPLADFTVDNGRQTGFWVYLYDPRTSSLIRPSAMYQTPPSHVAHQPATRLLRPGESRAYRIQLNDVLKFFGTSNPCNWLVVAYVKPFGPSIARSGPSTPIRVCQ